MFNFTIGFWRLSLEGYAPVSATRNIGFSFNSLSSEKVLHLGFWIYSVDFVYTKPNIFSWDE